MTEIVKHGSIPEYGNILDHEKPAIGTLNMILASEKEHAREIIVHCMSIKDEEAYIPRCITEDFS